MMETRHLRAAFQMRALIKCDFRFPKLNYGNRRTTPLCFLKREIEVLMAPSRKSEQHMRKEAKTANFHLRNITKVSPFLYLREAESLMPTDTRRLHRCELQTWL